MSEKNTTDQYIENINEKVLPFIDYGRLQASYGTDMVYAKGILALLHDEMVKAYGGEYLDEENGDEGFVVIPGVVRGKETGNMALALLDLDLSSSGEHWGTSFLCKYGVISQSGDFESPAGKEIRKLIGNYDYCYTAAIPGDIHIDKAKLPKELKSVLEDFRNHKVELSPPVNAVSDEKEKFALVEIFGRKALFSNGRVDRNDLPDGIFCYDLRHGDRDDSIPCTMEAYVAVNHFGTILCKTDFGLREWGEYIKVGYNKSPNFLGDDMTLDEYRALQTESDLRLPKVHRLPPRPAPEQSGDYERGELDEEHGDEI